MLVAVAGLAGVAVAAVTELSEGATSAQPADRADPFRGDVVSIYDVQTVDQFVVDATFEVGASDRRHGGGRPHRVGRDAADDPQRHLGARPARRLSDPDGVRRLAACGGRAA